MKKFLAAAALVATFVGGVMIADTAPAAAPDNRPAANTIACRDAQIERMRSMVLHVDTDPFTRDYDRDNRNVAAVLDAAGTLQELCK